jgi:parallel beta-helix repeat protein
MIRFPPNAIALAAFGCLSACASILAAENRAVATVADFAGRDSFTAGIQEAIHSLPAEGGVVVIPPGNYVLRRSVALRPHVTLRGAGSATVLTRGKEAVTTLREPAKKGDPAILVQSADGFRVGDEVFLRDNRLGGWYSAHAVVAGVEPGRIILEEPLWTSHKEGVFRPDQHARLANYFPMIRGNRFHWDKPLEDVAVTDLVLDGNPKENPSLVTDFTIAAVHFANVHDGLVRNVIVRGSVADGIGVQRGRDVRVESCLAEHCRVHGFHPGTSLRGGVFANNIGRHNGGDGLYFCADVLGITVTGNLFHDNRCSGIGGLGPGGDRFNVVSNNVSRNNGQHGIYADGGGNNLIIGNVCLNNSLEKPGTYSGIALRGAVHCTVTGNHCSCDAEEPTQRYGIEEIGEADGNAITGNQCRGNARGGIRVVGPNTRAVANVGERRTTR